MARRAWWLLVIRLVHSLVIAGAVPVPGALPHGTCCRPLLAWAARLAIPSGGGHAEEVADLDGEPPRAGGAQPGLEDPPVARPPPGDEDRFARGGPIAEDIVLLDRGPGDPRGCLRAHIHQCQLPVRPGTDGNREQFPVR